MIKEVSITQGTPTILPTLLVVIAISMIKDFIEDRKRWQSDDRENNSLTSKWDGKQFRECKFKELNIGDFVEIKNNNPIPADILLIDTSD